MRDKTLMLDEPGRTMMQHAGTTDNPILGQARATIGYCRLTAAASRFVFVSVFVHRASHADHRYTNPGYPGHTPRTHHRIYVRCVPCACEILVPGPCIEL